MSEVELAMVKPLALLSLKPTIYAANVADIDYAKGNNLSRKVFEFARIEKSKAVLVSAQVESELTSLSSEERGEFMAALGFDATNSNNSNSSNSGLKMLTFQAYEALGLQTYFTSGTVF